MLAVAHDGAVELPRLVGVEGLAPADDAPPGVVCWSGWLRKHPRIPVYVLLDGEPAASLEPDFIDAVCRDADRLLELAAEAAGLEAPAARWDPDLTFRAGRAWEVRFAEAPRPTELGIMVVFDGEIVTEVDDLAEWDYA
ncbi:hypothetical protein V6U90_14800 [Micromonospora sp. CPCC 206060]|uniref:hypothetical protein n=1 Tax=Micromonospora sp. CPCC 206060 TaxID=3122406 RepID=UPI002FF31FCE